MNSEFVRTEISGGIARIALDDASTRNAIGIKMARELLHAFRHLEDDPDVRVVLLCGVGGNFSAGGHIRDALDSAAGGTFGVDRFMSGYNKLIRTIFAFPKPVIGVVNGIAAGGALGVVLCTDIILAADNARFMQAFINIGLAPDCGTSTMLARRIGIGRAKELSLTGRIVDASEALHISLVDAVHTAADIDASADALATLIASKPPLGVSQAKQLMQRAQFATLDDALDMEAAVQGLLMMTSDFAEGAKSFIEKRRPEFIGR